VDDEEVQAQQGNFYGQRDHVQPSPLSEDNLHRVLIIINALVDRLEQRKPHQPGGWITSEITGGAKGFKGGPGTLGW
jgi:hypothetical protein